MALRRSNSGHSFVSIAAFARGGAMLSQEKESACARRVSTAGHRRAPACVQHAYIGPNTEPRRQQAGVARIRPTCTAFFLTPKGIPAGPPLRWRPVWFPEFFLAKKKISTGNNSCLGEIKFSRGDSSFTFYNLKRVVTCHEVRRHSQRPS